ncbi:MAG: VanZ family protein [Chloroflexi bacterium]|nr:VanZ family protein [Chloroflexota bacterium]
MKYIAVVFTIFIVAVILLADRGMLSRPFTRIYDFQYGDKLGHFVLFGLLNFFLTLTFLAAFPSGPSTRVALTIGLILALLAGLEEYSQKFYPLRTFDLVDLLASYLGLLAGGWIAIGYKKRQSP